MRRRRREHSLLLKVSKILVACAQASTSHSATGGERYGHRTERLLAVLHRWRDEAVKAGRTITRIALAFEAGRDGFWLARWLAARGVEAHVINGSSDPGLRGH